MNILYLDTILSMIFKFADAFASKIGKSGIFSTAFYNFRRFEESFKYIYSFYDLEASNVQIQFLSLVVSIFWRVWNLKKSQIFQYDEHCYLKFSLSTFKEFSEFLKLNCIFDALFLYVSKITYEINLSNILFIVTIKNKPNIQSRQNYIMVNKF